MKIFRFIEGVKTEIHDIEVDDNTELNQKISGQDLIRSKFTSEGFKYDIQIGDFVEFKDARYTILDEPQVKKSQNTFAFDLQFKSDQYLYNNVQLLNPETTETEFYLFGDAIDMISLVLYNMNRVYGQQGGTYFADYVEETEGKNMRFNNVNCLAALDLIAQEFGCEFVIKGYKITFRKKIGKETGLTFRYKKELQEIERQTIQNGELVTVLYPSGSDRNITREYGSQRLKIPKIEKNKDIFGTIERAIIFEDIYPRLKGVVSATENQTIFTDTSIDFDITEQLMGGMKAKVVFNTGDLAGREYEIDRYNHALKKITLIPYTDESDFKTPNEIFKPRVGDKYVLINIKMPQKYIDNAESELLERAEEYLDTFSQPNVIYKVGPHYPEFRRLGLNIELGDIVDLVDEDFGIDFKTRVLGLTQKINDPFKYTLEIGNQVTLSYFSKVINDQQDIRNDIYQNDQYYNEQFNRVYNNVRNVSAPFYVNRGEFDPSNFYYNNQNRRDYVFRMVKDGEETYKEWYFYIGEDNQRAAWITANWQIIGDNFEILATETLLAQNANIGKWLIQDGQIVSQAIYDSNIESEIEPRVQLNGNLGYIKLVSPKQIYGDAGYKKYKQTINIDSRDGKITASRGGDIYQESAEAFISSDGVKADFPGINTEVPLLGDSFNGEIIGNRGLGAVVGVGDSKLSASMWGNFSFIAGVVGRMFNTATNNPAPAYGGVFWGLKSFGRYVGVKKIYNSDGINFYSPNIYDELITCYQTSKLIIDLPLNLPEGRQIDIKRMYGEVVVTGKLFTHSPKTKITINPGDRWEFTWDGLYWTANWKVV